jgi:uncharacterized protein (DUF58 family)
MAGQREGTAQSASEGIDRGILRLEGQAHGVADRLPDLVMEAMRVSMTVTHGIHGRRRAGPGETFWQFRQFEAYDSATLIDWRRSASSDHLYVREREWEAAHTVWLWPDLSRSMAFKSHLAPVTKRDRAIVLQLALGELLIRGGERIGLLGIGAPSASRRATTRMAERIAQNARRPELAGGLPPKARLSRFSGAVLFSDFLDPPATILARLDEIAASGVNGHLVQILDPAEETLPYEGRAEFRGPEDGTRWIADRTESLRERYREKLLAHRAELESHAARLGWSFLVHHTDRTAAEPLLALIGRLQGSSDNYRWRISAPSKEAPTP